MSIRLDRRRFLVATAAGLETLRQQGRAESSEQAADGNTSQEVKNSTNRVFWDATRTRSFEARLLACSNGGDNSRVASMRLVLLRTAPKEGQELLVTAGPNLYSEEDRTYLRRLTEQPADPALLRYDHPGQSANPARRGFTEARYYRNLLRTDPRPGIPQSVENANKVGQVVLVLPKGQVQQSGEVVLDHRIGFVPIRTQAEFHQKVADKMAGVLERVEPANPFAYLKQTPREVLRVLCTEVVADYSGCTLSTAVDSLNHVLGLPKSDGVKTIKLGDKVDPNTIIQNVPLLNRPLHSLLEHALAPLVLDWNVTPDGSEIIINVYDEIVRLTQNNELGIKGSYRLAPGMNYSPSVSSNLVSFATHSRWNMVGTNTKKLSDGTAVFDGHPLFHLELARAIAVSNEVDKIVARDRKGVSGSR